MNRLAIYNGKSILINSEGFLIYSFKNNQTIIKKISKKDAEILRSFENDEDLINAFQLIF